MTVKVRYDDVWLAIAQQYYYRQSRTEGKPSVSEMYQQQRLHSWLSELLEQEYACNQKDRDDEHDLSSTPADPWFPVFSTTTMHDHLAVHLARIGKIETYSSDMFEGNLKKQIHQSVEFIGTDEDCQVPTHRNPTDRPSLVVCSSMFSVSWYETGTGAVAAMFAEATERERRGHVVVVIAHA